MVDHGVYHKDGTLVLTEVKNEKHPDAGHVEQKFKSVSKSKVDPKREYRLDISDKAESFKDPTYDVQDGKLHKDGKPVLVDGQPIHVERKPFPRVGEEEQT